MRKLIEATLVSLDGVVESPEKWANPYFAGEAKAYAMEALDGVDAFLLGRATYEKFSASWPHIEGDAYFDRINALPKYVASATLKQATWNATILAGAAADEVRRLKERPGGTIMKYGTGKLDRTLVEHGLIDEFHLMIFPLVLGSGTRLFEGLDVKLPKLRLTASKTFKSGVIAATYSAC